MRAVVGILVLLLLAGCATGGDRPSRGKASEVAARAADEGTTGRGEGRTGTKTDHQDAADPQIETWAEEDRDGGRHVIPLQPRGGLLQLWRR